MSGQWGWLGPRLGQTGVKGGTPEGFKGKIARVWRNQGGQGLVGRSKEMELFLGWTVQCGCQAGRRGR